MTLWMVSGRRYRTRISSERQITRQKNDEIQMTKPERRTNDQMPKDCRVGPSSFGLWASFVIRHSPATPGLSEGGYFVISGYAS